LERQAKELTSQIKSLTEERDTVSAAIIAVRDKALVEIDRTSKKTLENLNTLMNKTEAYAELEHQAGALEQEIVLAKAFKNGNPEMWKRVSRHAVCNLVAALIEWCRADATHNSLLPAPTGTLASRLRFYSWEKAQLEEILIWVLTALLIEQENKKALPSGG